VTAVQKARDRPGQCVRRRVKQAETHAWLAGWGGELPGEHFPKARRAAGQAPEHDPDLVEASLVLSLIKLGFEWLDRAIEQRDPGNAQLRILFDSGMEKFREDPRFDAVLERVGLDL
jgi:hypothetical protein